MIVCGIDPGINGGIAFINGNSLVAERIPTEVYTIGGKKRKFLDAVKIIQRLKLYHPDKIYIEKQQAMPGQGVSSTFKTGFSYGIYLGLFVALNLCYEEVSPRKWKKDLNVSSCKDQARQRASELLPQGTNMWSLRCEDGVAEAAMIAYWGSLNGSKLGDS